MPPVKIRQEIKQEIQNLDKEEKTYLLDKFNFLVNNIIPTLGFPQPLQLIIDNQILNDLKYFNTNKSENRKRYIRLLSVFLVFDYLLFYVKQDIKVVLTPAVFFEFNHKKIPQTENDFKGVFNECISLLSEFELEILSFFGLEDFKVAKKYLKNIEHDEKKIRTTITKLKQEKMSFKLFDRFKWMTENNEEAKCELFRPPFIIAYQIAAKQNIRLKYFNRDLVNHFIASHLEPEIYSHNAQTNLVQQKIKGLRNKSIEKTKSVSNIKKGKLKGLADIEIIQYCNIASQFKSNIDHTLFALTFDEKVSQLLEERTEFSVDSEEISREDDKESLKAKFDNFLAQTKRIELAQEKELKAIEGLAVFYQYLEPLIN